MIMKISFQKAWHSARGYFVAAASACAVS